MPAEPKTTDGYDQAAFDLIAGLRGGVPERCDFCDQPFNEQRYPCPEEGGAWACSDCLRKWGELP